MRAFPITRRLPRMCRIALGIALMLVVGKGLLDFSFELLHQLTAILEPDILNYFAAGRAMLNGLDPYVDVYESKPPGIILIAALSLAVTGTQALANILQVIVLLVIPVFAVFFAHHETRDMPKMLRRWALLVALLFGLLLGQYTAQRGGALYTESFGSAFGILYLWVVLRAGRGAVHPRTVLLAGVLLSLAVGMKEPFVLILGVSAALLVPRVRHWTAYFLAPVAIAAVLGSVALLILGLTRTYWTANLPQLFGAYSLALGSPWLFGFNVTPIAADLWSFSPALALALFGGILCHLSTAPVGKRLRTLAASLLIVTGPFVALLALFVLAASHGLPFSLHGVLRLPELQGSSALPLLWILTAFALFLSAAGVRSLWKIDGLRGLQRTALLFVALYAGILMMGMRGKYYPHHLAIAIPLYFTLFVLLIRWLNAELSSRGGKRVLGALVTVLAVGTLLFPTPTLQWQRLLHGHPGEMQRRAVAASFDRLMDACGYERFFAYGWEEEDLWGYTLHTPYGSSYNNMVWWLDRNVPAYAARFQKCLAETPIVVTEESRLPELSHDLGREYSAVFTQTPPACAQPFMPVGKYTVLFRQ